MKILVAAAAYPMLDGSKAQYFIHSRNLYYLKAGYDVTVLNFAISTDYEIDGVKVVSLASYENGQEDYDILICHAANVRNHLKFLKQYGNRFAKKMFVFHGHEILHINKYYPAPYTYQKQNAFKKIMQNKYDDFKLKSFRKYYLEHIDEIRLVFVSKWLYELFLHELKINEADLKGHACVISNGVGDFFENNTYEPTDKEYDFITIRSNLDGSTYCMDLVTKLAESYPEYHFLVIGKGEFFNHVEKPANLEFISKVVSHDEMREYINASTFALMLTRHDSQGLMACELATYGIPLITSDIHVTREVFETCPSLAFISNEALDLNVAVDKLRANTSSVKWEKYFAKNTIYKEIDFIKAYVDKEER